MTILSPNTLLKGGEYRIEKMLGQGGFGITYLAEQVALGRRVAIKEFFMKDFCERGSDSHVSIGSSGSREMVERFRAKFIKEAQTIAQFNNPHIVRIHDIFEDNGTAYYVMEYHDGGSLADLVKSRGRLSESEAVGYARQIADALGYLHARKINHLDVKPANVLLNEDGDAVLIDFGLSKHYDSEGNQTSTTPVGISHGYAPMEQYRRGGVGTFSPTSDIYSLGATLYKMLTGITPPEASDLLNEGLPPMKVKVSPAVRNAVEQAMAPMIKDRPQSIGEFLALLNGETPVVGVVVDDENTNVVVEEKTTIEPEVEPEVEPESTKTVEETTLPPTPEPTPKPTPKPAEKPKSRKGLIIGVIWVLICALLVAVAGVYMPNQQKVAEEQSLAEEQRQREAEEQRLAEEQRQREAEEQRLAEEQRQREAEEQRLAEEQRQREAEEQRLAEEQRKREAEEQRLAEEQRQREAEEQRLAEQRKREEAERQRLAAQKKVGDIITINGVGAIVYKVDNSGRHGMAMSLDETKCNWDDAHKWCSNHGSGWRLPTKAELQEIYRNKEQLNKVLSQSGYKKVASWHWSSEEYESDGSCAWSVYMYNGDTGIINKYFNNFVRAVSAF